MEAPPSSAPAAGPLLEARGISKRYGGIQALDGVDLSVGAGEVLGLVGENGAGKSTLVRILTGVEAADAGEMRLAGTPYAPRDPAAARAAGVAVIHQQFEFVDSLSVAENLFLHALPVRRRLGLPVVDRPRMRREAAVLLGRLQLDLDPARPVGELSLAERQLLEIARVLAARARLLVLDEPTASLERRDVERLFGLVRRARGEGTGVVFISHRLDEVLALGDRVTVLRNGRRVADRETASLHSAELVQLIVGRPVDRVRRAPRPAPGPTLLRLEGLRGGELTAPLTARVGAGEVVGLTGLLGGGAHHVPRLLVGASPAAAGAVVVRNRGFSPPEPARAVRGGIGFVAEDRRREGLVAALSVEQNLLLPNLRRVVGPFGFLSRRKVRALLGPLLARLGVTGGLDTPVAELSGGNQQKVVIARWLAAECDVLAMVEPTHGIDVGAKAEVHRLIRDFADGGRAVLFASVEVPEILDHADRTLIFRHGAVVGEAPSASLDEAAVLRWAAGMGS